MDNNFKQTFWKFIVDYKRYVYILTYRMFRDFGWFEDKSPLPNLDFLSLKITKTRRMKSSMTVHIWHFCLWPFPRAMTGRFRLWKVVCPWGMQIAYAQIETVGMMKKGNEISSKRPNTQTFGIPCRQMCESCHIQYCLDVKKIKQENKTNKKIQN